MQLNLVGTAAVIIYIGLYGSGRAAVYDDISSVRRFLKAQYYSSPARVVLNIALIEYMWKYRHTVCT